MKTYLGKTGSELNTGRGWGVFEANGEVHVVPIRDSIEHSLDLDIPCTCRPRVARYARSLVIHNAADGRQRNESAGILSKRGGAA